MTRAALSSRSLGSGPAQLGGLLRRLATAPDRLAHKRGALPDDPRSRLRCLLQEIDETVLPRRIELRINGRSLAYLLVCSRRLNDVEIAGQSAFKPKGGDLAADFAERLVEIVGTPGALAYVIGRQTEQHQPAEFTCSVDKLRAALGFDAQVCEIARLTEITSPIAIAQTSWVGDPTKAEFSGAETWRQLLDHHVRHFSNRDGAKTFTRRAGTNHAEGIAIPLSAEEILMLARRADRGHAAVLPYDAGLKAISFWQTASSFGDGPAD